MFLSMPFRDLKVAYATLGCKLNFAETSSFAAELQKRGARSVKKGEVADICIVNTCSVTEVADHKGRQMIHKLVKQHPGAIVAVVGCYAQLQPETVAAIEGVNFVLGANEKGELLSFLEKRLQQTQEDRAATCHKYYNVRAREIVNFMPSCSCGDRTRYFLKVQDGCDYYCTYCTIPFARGRSRNGSIADLCAQAREAAAKGAKEVVITGVNIGDFGKTTKESFLDLVKALDGVEGIERFRISSIEPNLLTNEVIDYCAHSRAFMPHFHIPLQSGCDEVLALMHRRYSTDFFAEKLAYVKAQMPDAFIGVDVIVGTRGETSEYFEQAYDFIKGLPISQLHVFSYSERPGTMALRIPHRVSPQEKHERSARLLQLSDTMTHDFYARYQGTERTVLLERSRKKGILSGFTDNYIKIEIPAAGLHDNELVRVRLGDFNEDHTALVASLSV